MHQSTSSISTEDSVLFSWCQDNLRPTFIDVVYQTKINFTVGWKLDRLPDGRLLRIAANRKYSQFVTYTIVCQPIKD